MHFGEMENLPYRHSCIHLQLINVFKLLLLYFQLASCMLSSFDGVNHVDLCAICIFEFQMFSLCFLSDSSSVVGGTHAYFHLLDLDLHTDFIGGSSFNIIAIILQQCLQLLHASVVFFMFIICSYSFGTLLFGGFLNLHLYFSLWDRIFLPWGFFSFSSVLKDLCLYMGTSPGLVYRDPSYIHLQSFDFLPKFHLRRGVRVKCIS